MHEPGSVGILLSSLLLADVTDYIVGFSERYTACADVDANEAVEY